ncbi:hypothetical protein MKZ38_003272 [Zalerion maritima]|uniref:JmjC domain-containing protein n=1 Tax=Zalerion maritima TaxID=339359 RepID=A0AAD5WQD7_9PEZI|nr:hypothetical protein MKZ38_003272 [Zalerion maritima]
MPSAMHPQAKFDPIPPNLDLCDLVEKTPNLNWVTKISTARIRNLSPADFERLVLKHVVENGRPLVIEGWNRALPRSLFSANWLEDHYDKKQENVRDISGQTDIPMTMGHYLRSMKQLTNQWTPTNFRDERRQRLYMKDIDCPAEWYDHLCNVIPANLFYMNSNVEEKARQTNRRNNNRFDMFDDDLPEKIAAIAGDLMSSLPEEMRAQNLMCYIGHEGTYTPAHREMCASLGQNIMVESSGSDNGEKPGSSIWFMTESKDREVVREYFLSMLGHDIEVEKHFAQINAWKKANFPVYVVEQKVGDFILIPPLAPHQVWNRGTRTMKVAWNRTTAQTLSLALHEALPKARLVCRDEQYKNKAIIYYTLKKYYQDLASMDETVDNGWLGLGQDLVQNSPRMKEMARDFKALFNLYTEILVDEMFAFKETAVEYVEFDSCVTCSYCRSNIFNRFLTCKHCVRLLMTGDEDTYDVCMECYAMGRSCVCISGLQWCEQFHWNKLVEEHEQWRQLIVMNDGYVDINKSPQPLELARTLTNNKSVAQICQEQLRRRPFKDITKVEQEAREEAESSGPELGDDGRPKKKKKKKQGKVKKGETDRCHVCCHREYMYKLQHCSTPECTEAYCYGVLYRAFDMLPQAVMEKEDWKCPKCLKICNCAGCRRSGLTTPYIPKNTLLGHDTRPIADDRSIEALVDFRVHNLSWLKVVGEEGRNKNSKRMQKLQEQAQAEKANANNNLEDALGDEEGMSAEQVNALQRPSLGEEDAVEPALANGDGEPDAPREDEDSAYPDPTGMGGRERMLGLGYYQQDDSPDKILFDPYQMPTAEALEEPQVSEYIKKTLRAAKRKARQENDEDPDFQGPRSRRKKAKTAQIAQDLLEHVDPGLFDESAAPEGDASASAAGAPVAAPPVAGPPVAPMDHLTVPYNINRPQLRNAQPIASYVEAEDLPVEEIEEAVAVDPIALLAQLDAGFADQGMLQPNDGRDPLDAAADAIRGLAGSLGAQTAPQRKTPEKKTMGRPRTRPDGTYKGWMPAVPVHENKPKARMTRASLLAEGFTEEKVEEKLRELNPPDDSDDDNEGAGGRRGGLDGLDNETQGQLMTDSSSASDSHISVESDDRNDKSFYRPYGAGERGRGRPRGRVGRGPGRPPRRSEVAGSATPSIPDSGKKRRGRPPKIRHSEGAEQSSTQAGEKPKQFLSMAERMALKGKKFKISGRMTRASAPAGGFTAVNQRKSVTKADTEMTETPALDDDGVDDTPAEPSTSAGENDGENVSMRSPSPLRSPSPAMSMSMTPAKSRTAEESDAPSAGGGSGDSPSYNADNDVHSDARRPDREGEEDDDDRGSPSSPEVWRGKTTSAIPSPERPARSPSPEVWHGKTTFPIPSPQKPARDPEESGSESDSGSLILASPPPKNKGPTIVRLGTESEDESELGGGGGGGSYHSRGGSVSGPGSVLGGSKSGGSSGSSDIDDDDEESNSDDEIPATTALIKRKPGRPPGRPNLRGSVALATRGRGGRGRGRPPTRGARRGRSGRGSDGDDEGSSSGSDSGDNNDNSDGDEKEEKESREEEESSADQEATKPDVRRSARDGDEDEDGNGDGEEDGGMGVKRDILPLDAEEAVEGVGKEGR